MFQLNSLIETAAIDQAKLIVFVCNNPLLAVDYYGLVAQGVIVAAVAAISACLGLTFMDALEKYPTDEEMRHCYVHDGLAVRHRCRVPGLSVPRRAGQ